ncbi:invasion associated locus B family protein [Oceanibium sediminis]|uniref:invasion associated locus B family protein n=1 Tax=Oceanibium sediminis TaxID=2026339 RepID=UPI000DD4A8AF|nr:invasion associated locus B family protein [Oceanibium sediminis]
MIRTLATAMALTILTLATAAPLAQAQTNESVAAFRDWSVFNPSDPRECYIVSPPVKTEARRNGSTVSVRRGDILLFVTIRPDEGVDKEVSFTGGYPFREGSSVDVSIGGTTFQMAPGADDAREWAWPPSPERDAEMIAAMRRGASATVTAVSSRGTTTIDEFSLLGFTAALEEAEKLCR